MTSANGETTHLTPDDSKKVLEQDQVIELNHRIKTDFMSHCFSFVQDDEEARECAQVVWNKYVQYVGDAPMLSAFFDTLPYHIKTSVLPKYQKEIHQWCEKLFHIRSDALLCSTFYSETFQRVIRYALKTGQYKRAVIYVSADFDPNLKIDLMSSIADIQFDHIANDPSFEDIIDFNQLEKAIQRDANNPQAYPFMVIASAGTALLGRCDELTKMKKLCEEHQVWLHVTGDLLGSLSSVSAIKDNVNINCDSLTIDVMKLFGIQNLPYLTFFLRSTTEQKTTDEGKSTFPFHPLDDFVLHSPSINFLSIWSISQRCSNENILYHMKQSFQLVNSLINGLKSNRAIRILTEEDNRPTYKYHRICSGDASEDVLPKTVVVFRFESNEVSTVESKKHFNGYIDLLNLWLFDKLSQQYPKMNIELLKSVHFRSSKTDDGQANEYPVHALRFAPLEHLFDSIEQSDIQAFVEDTQRYTDILFATMTARLNLLTTVSKYENVVSVPLANWAGIGAVRYVPSHINPGNINDLSAYEINSIQAELARKLQTSDSAFSLGGGGADDQDAMFYLRLGMIRRRDDLEILLQKISTGGQETEKTLKYVEDMAEKIKVGIEKAQKDLQDENLQLLAQDGLLRQLPLISSVMSWWSPAPSSAPLATKGRSFDLNSGRVESTENTYAYRMQINKQSPHAPTHNEETAGHSTSDSIEQTPH